MHQQSQNKNIIIPKERPSSFSLNEGEKNGFLYEVNNAELLSSNYVF